MNKHVISCLLLSFTVNVANAAEISSRYPGKASVEETTGFFSGVLLGGLAGGPPGVIIGGAMGALMGDGWRAKKRVGDLQASLYQSRLELAQLREQTESLQQENQLARNQLESSGSSPSQYYLASLQQQTATPCCDNTVLSLHFRSGSSTIEHHYEEQLASLVKLAKQMPAALVEITGYADRTGDADRNLALSRQRSEAVKQYLHAHGILDSSLTTIAYGETKPLQARQALETDFFDRRVIVRLRDASQQYLSQVPDGK